MAMPQYTNGPDVVQTKERKKNRRITRKETFTIIDLYRSLALEIIEEGKTHKFKPGWNDARVIEEFEKATGTFKSGITTLAMGTIRREFFGEREQIAKPPLPERVRVDRNEYQLLKDRVTKLQDSFDTLKDKHNRMIDRLGQRLGEGWPTFKQV